MDRARVRDGRGVHNGVGERDGAAGLDGHCSVCQRAGKNERIGVVERHSAIGSGKVPAVAHGFADVRPVHEESDGAGLHIAEGDDVVAVNHRDPPLRVAALQLQIEEPFAVRQPRAQDAAGVRVEVLHAVGERRSVDDERLDPGVGRPEVEINRSGQGADGVVGGGGGDARRRRVDGAARERDGIDGAVGAASDRGRVVVVHPPGDNGAAADRHRASIGATASADARAAVLAHCRHQAAGDRDRACRAARVFVNSAAADAGRIVAACRRHDAAGNLDRAAVAVIAAANAGA